MTAIDAIVVTSRSLPLLALSPNGRAGSKHWAPVAEARESLRAEVAMLAIGWAQAGQEPLAVATVGIIMRVCRKRLGNDGYYRPRDIPNMVNAMKPAYDGLTDAQVLIDDDAKHMKLGFTDIVEVDSRDAEGFTITITPL